MTSPVVIEPGGAEAAAAPTPSAWRPLIWRAAIGGIALLGLSGIGAASMLAGLDGAHASPPAASSVWVALAASAAPSVVVPESPPASAPASAVSAPGSAAGATGSAAATIEGPLVPPTCSARTEDGRVILNLAKLEDLRKIPGVGPKRAEAILALRAKLKRFKRGADLLRVRGVGPKSLARMQAHFVVDPPVGSNCSLPNEPRK